MFFELPYLQKFKTHWKTEHEPKLFRTEVQPWEELSFSNLWIDIKQVRRVKNSSLAHKDRKTYDRLIIIYMPITG